VRALRRGETAFECRVVRRPRRGLAVAGSVGRSDGNVLVL